MHIPDGYMAPQTTIPVLAGMIPVWGVAARQFKSKVGEKNLPVLSLGAAFSFTIMMMNVPVAGGSSAHAVGAVLIAILLGPWAATVAVSAALFIQALVFGDGGILAFGMNCLNMAVIMPFSGWFIYRLVVGKTSPGSVRSLVASAIAGYVGINLAAFMTAVEFGIQPLLFTAADGTALYCPYPLSVSIPAMMLAHLLVAGPIEAVVTAAAVAYIAKAAPQMFLENQQLASVTSELKGSGCAAVSGKAETFGRPSFFRQYKAVIIPLIILICLTPLGLMTKGTAWGEWGGDELKSMVGYVPAGFKSTADWWKSLMPDYSISALGSGGSGSITAYIISAVIGIGLIALLILLFSVYAKKKKDKQSA